MSVEPLRLSSGPGGATVLIAGAGIEVGAPIVVDLLGRGPSSHGSWFARTTPTAPG